MPSKPADCSQSKGKENLCPKAGLSNDTSSPILKKTISGKKGMTSTANTHNSTPLRQTTLDSSLLRTSSPLSDKTAEKRTTTPKISTEEVSCKDSIEQKHIETTVDINPASPATIQTTLTISSRQVTAKKQSRPTKPKSGKAKGTRQRSVDRPLAQSAGSVCPLSAAASASPKKSVGRVRQTGVPDAIGSGETGTAEHLTGRKRQTQLTTFGIRRTARQFAKDMQRERDVNIQQCLRNNVEEGMKIIQTEEKGRGIIATRPFYDEQFVVEYAGELISEKEAKGREIEYKKDASIGSYMFYFVYNGQKYCVDATAETPRLGRLINHSRLHPNCQVRTIPIDGVPRLALFARRPILTGEELLYDYGDRDKETLEAHPWLKT